MAQNTLCERSPDKTYFKRGKAQLAAYLKSERIAAGYYVVFSTIHYETDELYSEEVIAGGSGNILTDRFFNCMARK